MRVAVDSRPAIYDDHSLKGVITRARIPVRPLDWQNNEIRQTSGRHEGKIEARRLPVPGIIKMMNREYVLTTLRQHEPELKAAGIVHLRLHGSVARAEAQTSDVDLIAELDPARQLSLLGMVGLENRLSDILGVPVDLSPAHMLRGPVAERAAREAILAF